ncbi:tripartite tricarboxylate transporter TctB family protein [uncultured Desulfovibrio sp.]|uniref:tripartite tricarboxylate transporter TctB family protein n=1 Tax=uncultured Desulfovibrio sp. TaxID=167968 RepID=UPI002804A7BC|nr:tripartite tricarboxylate transporter TctB family protein [uncultured Desulfovibrio sp.]
MTRSDIGIVAIIYATCLLFLTMTLRLKAAAQVYPLCLIGGLALLNTLYLATRLWRLFGRARDDDGAPRALINDLPEIFANFLPGQFLFIVIASVAYLALMHFVGFYPAGLVYMLAVMWRLHVPPLHMGITLAVLGALIYAVFSLFLQVPLPRGILFG